MSVLKQDQAVILIVDSDPLMMTGMAAVLHMQGYECHCAQSSEAAMTAAASLELDLIICDVKLNNESGLALCKRIHEQNDEHTPVLYISGTQHPDIIRRAHEVGGAYYLRKPFDPKLLIDLVDKALWLPHLVDSNMTVEANEQSTSASSTVPPIHITPMAPAAGESSGNEIVHQHGSAPTPMRKSKTGAAIDTPSV